MEFKEKQGNLLTILKKEIDEFVWRQPDLKNESFVPVLPILGQLSQLKWLKRQANSLDIFLSFITPDLIGRILETCTPDHLTIHHLPDNNTIDITTSMIYESLSLQIYLLGHQNVHASSRDRSTENAGRPAGGFAL